MREDPIKCVVWDLDGTIWKGTLLEGDSVATEPAALDAIRALDARGVLNSIVSKNDESLAKARLVELGLMEYFVAPQVSWDAKSEGVRRVSSALQLRLESLAFVDDDAFERGEVAFSLPEVRCFAPDEFYTSLDDRALKPDVITEEGSRRRLLYQAEAARHEAEDQFKGAPEKFLETLDMQLRVRPAESADLSRAWELTVRTNQLNTTGRVYSARDLQSLLRRDDHEVLVAELTDCYGDYGKIGLAVIRSAGRTWHAELLLLSCRVLTRGVGAAWLAHLVAAARSQDAEFVVDVIPNGRNRMMIVTLRLLGFEVRDTEPPLQQFVAPAGLPRPALPRLTAPDRYFDRAATNG